MSAVIKLPPAVVETGFDDLPTINDDIPSLFNQYIVPIDNLRSISRPGPPEGPVTPSSDFKNLQVDSIGKLESRAHAFYRMLGFPVVAGTSFYNSGFDPGGGTTTDAHGAIDKSFIGNTSLQVLINIRETNPLELLQIFSRADITSSVYALVLRYPRPFKVIADGKAPLDVDPQFFTVADRATEIFTFASLNTSLSDVILGTSSAFSKTAVGTSFSSGRHILKPFIVDPRIERTVMPDTNKICVPFLKDKTSTKLNSKDSLFRPGIEFIIRQRLADTAVDKAFLTGVQQIIDYKPGSSLKVLDVDLESLIETVSALADANKLSSGVKDKLSGFTNIQIEMVGGLVRTIKAVCKKTAEAIHAIDLAKKKINWVPVPSSAGPESGARGAKSSNTGTTTANFELNSQITELTIQKLNAQRTVQEQADIGRFAVPFVDNTATEDVTSYEERLGELTDNRDQIANSALVAMGVIEIVSGEISGLGLVDVLAIYTALWSIDIKDLIGFLDSDSISRLKTYNPDLKPPSGNSIITSLTNFESALVNILSFADLQLTKQLTTPLNAPGDSI